jgi:hypothetical protein
MAGGGGYRRRWRGDGVEVLANSRDLAVLGVESEHVAVLVGKPCRHLHDAQALGEGHRAVAATEDLDIRVPKDFDPLEGVVVLLGRGLDPAPAVGEVVRARDIAGHLEDELVGQNGEDRPLVLRLKGVEVGLRQIFGCRYGLMSFHVSVPLPPGAPPSSTSRCPVSTSTHRHTACCLR